MNSSFQGCDFFQVNKKAQHSLKRRATAYTVPVAVLTFKVIQGRWFLCYLKGNMRFHI